jgi:hypothetical protein
MCVIPDDEMRIRLRVPDMYPERMAERMAERLGSTDGRQHDGGLRAGLRYPLPPLRYGQNN